MGFPGGSAGKESTCNAGDLGLIPGLGRSPGEEKGYPPQYSGEFHGLYSPWGYKESDRTEGLSHTRGVKWFPLLFTFRSLFSCHPLCEVFADLHISNCNLPVLLASPSPFTAPKYLVSLQYFNNRA